MPTREDIIWAAKLCLGTPYHHIGRKCGVGLDCIGLIVHVGKTLQIPICDIAAYPRHPDGKTLPEEMAKCLDPIPVEEAQLGDVLAFWFKVKGKIQHASIKTEHGMLHTYAGGMMKVIEEPDIKPFWQERLTLAFRYRGIDGIPFQRYETPKGVGSQIPDDFDPEVEKRRMQSGGCCGQPSN